jgi:hypothetical protein
MLRNRTGSIGRLFSGWLIITAIGLIDRTRACDAELVSEAKFAVPIMQELRLTPKQFLAAAAGLT